jgi:hypothetical protein
MRMVLVNEFLLTKLRRTVSQKEKRILYLLQVHEISTL